VFGSYTSMTIKTQSCSVLVNSRSWTQYVLDLYNVPGD